jgi:PAS domain S-box-containing protein
MAESGRAEPGTLTAGVDGRVDRLRWAAAGWDLDARLGYAFGAATIAMAFTSPTGHFLKVNSAFCTMMGRSEVELCQLGVADVTHPADIGESRAAIRRLRDGATETMRTEKRYLRLDGTVRWGLTTARLVHDDSGAVLGLFAEILDVTDAKARESALRETTERLQGLAEGAEDFLIFRTRFRPALACEFISSGVQQMLGRSQADCYARPGWLFEALHPDDVAIVQRDRNSVAAARMPKTLRLLHTSGRVVWTAVRTWPIVDDDGQVAGVEGIAHDITVRVQAEAALRDSERRFRSLAQNATDLVCLIGPDGGFEYVSPSATEILGYPAGELAGRPAREFCHPDDTDRVTMVGAGVGSGDQAAVEARFRHHDGSWRWMEGVLSNLLDDPAVAAYILNLRDVTDRRQLSEELVRRANYDQLTGLPSRLGLRDHVAALLAGPADGASRGAAVSIQVKGLGSISEAFGYDRADALVGQVADRLRGAAAPGWLLARTSSDEFAIAIPAVTDAAAITSAADDVLTAFLAPFLVGDDPFQLDATVGAAMWPEHGRDADILLRRADRARSAAHGADRSFRLYSPDLDEGIVERLSLLGRLRHAISSDQLALHYQPKLSLRTGTVYGVEALLRWHHPELGFVAPNRFIPLAERSGLIGPLTGWVIEEAARQSQLWHQQGLDLSIAVNITPRSLQNPEFPDEVIALLAVRRLLDHAVWLEITERAVTIDPETAADACRRLSAAGIPLSLDDFGTGQSSLGYLATLPISELKIDISFVRPLMTSTRADAIVRMIIDLAHDLGQTAIAEGVEDQATLDRLSELGCDAIQGYHLCKPLPAAELATWLAARRTAGEGTP